MANKYNEIDTTKYDAVQLEEYNGTYSIKSIQIGQNETYYPRFAYPSEWSKATRGWVPGKKSFPVMVRLGDKQTALNTLRQIIKDLQGG